MPGLCVQNIAVTLDSGRNFYKSCINYDNPGSQTGRYKNMSVGVVMGDATALWDF